MDVSLKLAPKSAMTSAQCKRFISKDEVSDTIKYDESMADTKVKVWSHADEMYHESVVAEFDPDNKMHKVSYVDGDEDTMNMRKEKCKILKKIYVLDDEEQNTKTIVKDNDVKESENEAVIPPETEKDKETIQEFSPKAIESKHAATANANVSSQCQSNSVLDESSFRSNKEKPVPQEVETAFPSKSRPPLDETRVNKETDVSKSALKSASREGNITETPGTSAKRKHSTSKDKVYDTVRYDESLVGTKVKVWWPEDNMYYKGVVAKFYPDKKKHKVSYVDGDEEILNLRTQHWKILKESSLRDDKEQYTEVQSEKGSPDIHKKKKSKTDPAASQEKIKCSANKVGDVSSFGKSKGSTPKDNLSTQKNGGKSCDAATTASKEAAKSKEDEERLKINTKTKAAVNKSNSKTPPSSSKFNVSPTKAEKMEYDKERLRLEAEKLKIKADKGQSKIRLQNERLRLKAEKMELLKKESDIRIMMIDARVMPEMQRLYFEELQREIIMRRSHA